MWWEEPNSHESSGRALNFLSLGFFLSPVLNFLLPSKSFFFFFLVTWEFYCAEGFCFNEAQEMISSSLREVQECF